MCPSSNERLRVLAEAVVPVVKRSPAVYLFKPNSRSVIQAINTSTKLTKLLNV
jgi:hypothetical protein